MLIDESEVGVETAATRQNAGTSTGAVVAGGVNDRGGTARADVSVTAGGKPARPSRLAQERTGEEGATAVLFRSVPGSAVPPQATSNNDKNNHACVAFIEPPDGARKQITLR